MVWQRRHRRPRLTAHRSQSLDAAGAALLRRIGAWYHATQLKLRLDFANAYAGTLHLYAVDWATTARRATYAVADGTTTKTISITTAFDQGAWMHYPVDVPAGGYIDITATRTAGTNVLLNGLFLGGTGAPPAPSPSPKYDAGVQGDWVGSAGVVGYALPAWNGTSDVVALPPGVAVNLQRGTRTFWATSTDKRAVENQSETLRKAAAYKDTSQVKASLTFNGAFSGWLSLYVLDWDSTSRRETLLVDDGSGPRSVAITTDFNAGAWVRLPVSVAAGGSISITVTRNTGSGAVISGIFLD